VVDPGSNVMSKADHGPAQLCEKPMGDRHHSPPPPRGRPVRWRGATGSFSGGANRRPTPVHSIGVGPAGLGQPRSLTVGEAILSYQAHVSACSSRARLWDPMCWEAEIMPPKDVAIAGRHNIFDLIFESVGFLLGQDCTIGSPEASGGSAQEAHAAQIKDSSPTGVHGPSVSGLLGLSVSYPPAHSVTQDSNVVPLSPSPVAPASSFINIERGAKPVSMQEGFIPSSLISFECALSKPLRPTVIATPPLSVVVVPPCH
jgi:hypothetical protein